MIPESITEYRSCREGRAVKYHRAQIRAFLGFREPTVQDTEELAVWLSKHVLPQGHADKHVNAAGLPRKPSARSLMGSYRRFPRFAASGRCCPTRLATS